MGKVIEAEVYTVAVWKVLPALEGARLDTWLATDKAQHVVFCAAVAAAIYILLTRSSVLHPHRFTASAAASIAAGLLKEVGDALQVPCLLQLVFVPSWVFSSVAKKVYAGAMLHRLVWDFLPVMSTQCRVAGRASAEWTACYGAMIESGAAAVVARRLVIQGPSSRCRGGLRSSRRSCCC